MTVEDRGTAGVPRWHYKFMCKGVLYSGAIPSAKDDKEAKDYEEKKRAEVILGLYGRTDPGSKDFCEFVDEFYLPYARENKETWRHDEFRCEVLKHFFRDKRFCDIMPMLVTKFINQRLESKTVRKETLENGKVVNSRRSPTTVRKEFTLLSTIFNMAIDEEVAVRNPCRRVPKKVLKKIPARNKRGRFLTFEEEVRLFDLGLTEAREHILPLVKLALNTGARRGSLLTLEREHVNLSPLPVFYASEIGGVKMKIKIRPNHLLIVRNKGNKPYSVPLNRVARGVLEGLLSDGALTDFLFLNERTGKNLTEIKRGFRSACELAGLDDFTFHDLRHTFATRLNKVGVDKIARRDLMGHAGADMTDDYTHSEVETMQRAVDDLTRYAEAESNKIRTNESEQVRLRLVSA